MPYIVCVNLPGCLPEAAPYAVATLDEARESAWSEISIPDDVSQDQLDVLMAQVQVMGVTGAVIGPMHDGYVVDVQLKDWSMLARSCAPPLPIDGQTGDLWTKAEKDKIINAYNEGSP